MKSLIRSFIHGGLAALLLLSGMAAAQEEEALKAQIVTLSWKGKVDALWFATKDGPKTLEAYERGFTAAESYVGPRRIAFHRARGELDLPPDKRPQPVAVATLPADGGEVLLIFVENPASPASWRVEVMDNSITNLPAGGYRVVNMTKEVYSAAFDRDVISIKASGTTIVRPAKRNDVRDLPVQIAKGKQLVYSSIWGHRESQRGTVFLMPGKTEKDFLTIRRYFQPVLQPETAGNP
ncbi:hypothetical protein OVA24_20970 [Luteolibacter sp. SL250]|uniref:hypothetical protein n=1 Tax=Luteolibacter sp. SL250 TaxID=2995170 RepID=UPI00226E4442|nr:hypothetical protein [Luteolibacter sp. SL250]WAC19694.1 hypothetical protein OVA24_20970 [Luteolibacter sp. SL250]